MEPIHWAITEGHLPVLHFLVSKVRSPLNFCPFNRPTRNIITSPTLSTNQKHLIDPHIIITSPTPLTHPTNQPKTYPTTQGADINARDKQLCTPLLIAAQYGQAEAAAYLVQGGADTALRDVNRWVLGVCLFWGGVV